jgi:hypothetical protein
MTEYPADSPVIARPYCPGCEPDADPMREVLDVRWCDEHVPDRDGSDDARIAAGAFLSGTAEAGGEVNRRWCDLVHRAGRDAPAGRPGQRRPRRLPPRPAGPT